MSQSSAVRVPALTAPAAPYEAAVVPHLLRSAHGPIGPLITVPALLYAEVEVADLGDLHARALRRYTDRGIAIEANTRRLMRVRRAR